jgi:HK97 family phage major capsid protein
MDFKEFKDLLDEATKGLKTELETAKGDAAEAKAKTVDALNKYEELKAEFAKSASVEMMEALEMRVKSLTEMAETLAVKQNMPGLHKKTANVWDDLKGQFETKKAQLAQFVAAKSGYISLDLKDGIIGSGVFGDRVIFGLREPGIDKVPFRENFIFDLITTINGGAGSNPLSWVELQPVTGAGIVGAPGWTAESADKPNMKWQWVENKVTAETLAAVAYITRQATLNWPMLQAEIQNELGREIRDVLDNAVLNADGTGNTILGIASYAKAFSVGTINAIAVPNDYDVIRAAIAQVRRGGAPTTKKRGGFRPNVVLVSVDKAAEMDLTRGTDGHYVMPPFTSADGTVIKGVRVIETNFVDDDAFIVGEFSRYLFNFVEGIRIDIGYINDQFIKNQFTIRAELMGMGRVKANEAFAFVKGTFQAAKDALVIGPL